MIKINLLPMTMRVVEKPKETVKPTALGMKILVYALGGGGALIVLAYVVLVVVPLWMAHISLSGWQKQWTAMEKEFQQVDAFDRQKLENTGRLGELNRKKEERVRWAKILNAVSDVMPTSIQLTKIVSAKMTESVPAPPKPASPDAPQASPGQQEKVERAFQVMELEGLAEKGLLGEEDLKTLLEQMRSHPLFEECFERIDLIGVATLPDMTKKFSLRCRFKENKPCPPSPA